jgi:hypothetical protein
VFGIGLVFIVLKTVALLRFVTLRPAKYKPLPICDLSADKPRTYILFTRTLACVAGDFREWSLFMGRGGGGGGKGGGGQTKFYPYK